MYFSKDHHLEMHSLIHVDGLRQSIGDEQEVFSKMSQKTNPFGLKIPVSASLLQVIKYCVIN